MAASPNQGRTCSQPGCRARATGGTSTCVAHRPDGDCSSPAGESAVNHFEELVRAGRHADLIEMTVQAALDAAASDGSLALELGVLRLMLQRVVTSELIDGDLREITQIVTRLVETIIRTLRMRQSLATGLEDDLRTAISRVFVDHKLEEEP